MKRRWIMSIALSLILAVLAGTSPGETARPHLVVISIDGLVPAYYVRPDRWGLRIPHLRQLRRQGAYAEGVIGVYPSVTYPSHTTIMTGALPADHGIVANTIFDEPTKPPARRWYWQAAFIKVDTLWAAAKRAGLRVASVGWPVTVEAQEIDWNLPEIWDPFAPRSAFPAPFRKYATPGLIERVLKWAKKTPSDYRPNDDFRVDAAVYLIEQMKPHLLLVHLIDLDGTQHRYGPYSDQAFQMTEKQDARVGRLLEALRRADLLSSTTVAIVSDHGFMRIDKLFNPGVALVRAGLVQLDERGGVRRWAAAIHSNGGSAAVYLKEPENRSAALKVEKLFRAYAGPHGLPLRQILTRQQLDRYGANPRAFLFLEAASHYGLTAKLRGPLIEDAPPGVRGKHGYLPDRPEMYASLILWGRGIRARRHRELARMVDIAPTFARLLHIEFHPPAYSRPLTDMIQSVKQKEMER